MKTQKKIKIKFYLNFILKLLSLNWVYCKSTTKFQKLCNNKSKE
jgi:hypothetical protein